MDPSESHLAVDGPVVLSMGIYGEVPGERYGSQLDPYRDSAAVIETSDLDYTILRPGWFTRDDEVSYEITQKGQPFKGHDVSLNSPLRSHREARAHARDGEPTQPRREPGLTRTGFCADTTAPELRRLLGLLPN